MPVSGRDLPYRADIDGLRALAVLPVLAYHAGYPGFSGGYVGVDIFFVISGYLITSLILVQVERGAFSYWAFLERRARRLVPAAVLVTAVTWAIGFVLLLPQQFIALGRSIAWFGLFIANHYFLGERGYFVRGEPQPMLHTWSLSVEEQFYFVFALALLVVLRLARRHIETMIVAGFALSLALAGWLVAAELANAAFFLAAPRFWELLAGAWLALGRLPAPGPILAFACRILGLGLIAVAIVAYDDSTPFPGLAALVPVLGAALVIHAGTGGAGMSAGRVSRRDIPYRALIARPVVYVGKISYGLYLWHWPLLVYGGLISGASLIDGYGPRTNAAVALGASFVMAALSYRYVERPFRERRWLAKRRPLLVTSLACIVLVVVAGTVVVETRGVPWRLPADVRQFAAAQEVAVHVASHCVVRDETDLERPLTRCDLGQVTKPKIDFAVWGDSHSAASTALYNDMANEKGLRGVLFSAGGCFASIVTDLYSICHSQNIVAYNEIRKDDIKYIFLHGYWPIYLEQEKSLDIDRDRELMALVSAGLAGVANDQAGREAVFVNILSRTVEALAAQGRHVWIVQSVPGYKVNLPTAMALRGVLDLPPILQTRADHVARNAKFAAIFEALAANPAIHVIDVVDRFCPGTTCALVDEAGALLYRDANHVSDRGALFMRPLIEPALDAIRQGEAGECAPSQAGAGQGASKAPACQGERNGD